MPNYERKTSDIFISEQLRNILEIFKDKSEVAKLLLQRRLPRELLIEDHVNFIGVSSSDQTKISYLTTDRIELISKSETEDFWSGSKRFISKPGSFIGKILKDIPSKEVENFSNLYKTFSNQEDFKFKIVSGEDIRKYYLSDYYERQSGSLGSSCMKSGSCQEYFDLYVNNPQISMLIMQSPDCNIMGRSLLWNIDDFKVMDRIYTIKDDVYTHHFCKWAIDNGYLHRTKQNWASSHTFSDGKQDSEKLFTIQLKESKFDRYPYMDTFKWLDLDTGMLSNFQPEHFKESYSDKFRTLSLACGGSERGNYLEFCEIDREYVYHDDVIQVNGIRVNTRHCNYSDALDRWILRSESFYSEELESHIYLDLQRNDKDLIKKRIENICSYRNRYRIDELQEMFGINTKIVEDFPFA
jgi:hypothetical protein